jgi:hypothetical protein
MKWVWIGVVVLAAARVGAQEPGEKWVKRVTLEVKETAGIRRNGYPASATLNLEKPLKDFTEVRRFRLLDRGKVIPANFQTLGSDRQSVRVAFHSTHAPLETRIYTVEYGPGVEEQSETKRGLSTEQEGNVFTVRHPGDLRFVFSQDLRGLLRRVHTGGTEYLRPDSTGLYYRGRARGLSVIGGSNNFDELVKLRQKLLTSFGFTELIGRQKFPTEIRLSFPLSRSWVRVDFSVEDPEGHVTALGVDLNLNIQGEPALVDFGAGTSVYTTLKKGQSAVLRSGPLENKGSGWQVLIGPVKAPLPFVVMPPDRPSKAEGWAHVMDKQRCTAVAVADFAQDRLRSEIVVDADGRLRCEREFDPKTARKTLTFWLHFVSMPVQIGAATSPQSMMNPLQVTVRKQ